MNLNIRIIPLKFLLLFCALSFLFQPTDIRLFGFSISLIAFSALMLFGLLKAKIELLSSAYIVVLAGYLIAYDYLLNGLDRSLVVFLMLATIILYKKIYCSERVLKEVYRTLGIICFTLTLLGLFRFVTGYNAELSENISGFLDTSSSYVYLGISYLPATRNSDALYFSIAALCMAWSAKDEIGLKALIYWACFSISFIACILSMSRGVWVALVFSLISFFGYKAFLKKSILILLVVYLVTLFYEPTFVDQIKASVLSFIDVKSANNIVSGYYTYSNDQRMGIYSLALLDILSNPFGYGASYIPSYSYEITGSDSVHSENLYLDFLIIFGLSAIPIFIYTFNVFNSYLKYKLDECSRLSFSFLVLLLIYSVFNSWIDLIIGWFIVLLIVLNINLIKNKIFLK